MWLIHQTMMFTILISPQFSDLVLALQDICATEDICISRSNSLSSHEKHHAVKRDGICCGFKDCFSTTFHHCTLKLGADSVPLSWEPLVYFLFIFIKTTCIEVVVVTVAIYVVICLEKWHSELTDSYSNLFFITYEIR